MELKIDETQVQESINKTATKAVEEAFSSYSLDRAIRDTIGEKVIKEAFGQALTEALDQIDISALAAVLAKEIQRQTIRTTIFLLQEQAAATIYNLRGHRDYDSDKERKMATIKAELYAAKAIREEV